MNTNNSEADFASKPLDPAITTSPDLNASLTSVAKGATIILGGLMAGNLLGMVNQIILGRSLGSEDYGLFNLSMSVVMIAGTLCVFGFFGSLSRFVPFHLEKNERNVVRSVIDFSSLFSFSLGILFAVVVYLLSDRLAVTISVFLLSLFLIQRLYGAILAFSAGILVTTILAFWLIRRRIFTDYLRYPRVAVARSVLSFSWPLALIVLSLGIAADAFAGTSGNILVAGGRTKLNLACEIIAAVTNIGLNILLIPLYGIVGAAAATAMSYLARNISSMSLVYRSYGMHPYTKNYLNIIFSGLAAIVIIYILKIYSPFSWWSTMFILGALFIAFYFAAALFSRSFDRNDLVILEAIERRTGVKLDSLKKFVK